MASVSDQRQSNASYGYSIDSMSVKASLVRDGSTGLPACGYSPVGRDILNDSSTWNIAENLFSRPGFASRGGTALDFSMEILKISASGADFNFVAWLAGLGGKHGSGRTSGRN